MYSVNSTAKSTNNSSSIGNNDSSSINKTDTTITPSIPINAYNLFIPSCTQNISNTTI